jgi:hypothetical protein
MKLLLLIVFTLILIGFIIYSSLIFSQNKRDICLDLHEEVDFFDIDEDFYVLNYGEIRFFNANEVSIFNQEAYYIYHIENRTATKIAEKGHGPGEFQFPSPLVQLGERFYFTDSRKHVIIMFDSNYQLLQEKRLDNKPLTVFKFHDELLGIVHKANSSGKIITFYDSDLNIKHSVIDSADMIQGYAEPLQYFLYEWAKYKIIGSRLYIFFTGLPVVQIIDLEENTSVFINYEKELSFKPTTAKITLEEIVLYYMIQINDSNVTNQTISLRINNFGTKKSDKPQSYFAEFDCRTNQVSMLELNSAIKFSPILYYDNHFIQFDDEEEKINIFKKIMKAK